jgi:hypothetical protein
MSRAGDTAIAAEVLQRRKVVVDVILLLMRNGRILLRERAKAGRASRLRSGRYAGWRWPRS